MTKYELAIDRFGKEVAVDAIDQGIEAAIQSTMKLLNDLDMGEEVLSDFRSVAMKAAEIAAENAIAAFFSNHDLVGGFRLMIESEDGEFFDLGDEYDAPLIVAFHDDGWPNRFSKYLSKT